jgi:predicted DNA-binding antitoxin AbrB/MazE fold protein
VRKISLEQAQALIDMDPAVKERGVKVVRGAKLELSGANQETVDLYVGDIDWVMVTLLGSVEVLEIEHGYAIHAGAVDVNDVIGTAGGAIIVPADSFQIAKPSNLVTDKIEITPEWKAAFEKIAKEVFDREFEGVVEAIKAPMSEGDRTMIESIVESAVAEKMRDANDSKPLSRIDEHTLADFGRRISILERSRATSDDLAELRRQVEQYAEVTNRTMGGLYRKHGELEMEYHQAKADSLKIAPVKDLDPDTTNLDLSEGTKAEVEAIASGKEEAVEMLLKLAIETYQMTRHLVMSITPQPEQPPDN